MWAAGTPRSSGTFHKIIGEHREYPCKRTSPETRVNAEHFAAQC